MTPLDFKERYRSFKGAAFSFAPVLTQSAWFRPNNRSEDVKGLYLVGAGNTAGRRHTRRPLLGPHARRLGPRRRLPRSQTRFSRPADSAACRELIRGGSRSFFAASLLLPDDVREAAYALYGFCRLSDDAVDIEGGQAAAVAAASKIALIASTLSAPRRQKPLIAHSPTPFCDSAYQGWRWTPCWRACSGMSKAGRTKPSPTHSPMPLGSRGPWAR